MNGDLRLEDQADTVAAAGTCEVTGLLYITGTVTDLAPLAGLTRVGGLNVFRCSALTDLTPLAGLTTITGTAPRGDLLVSENAALTSLMGLHNLTEVPTDLSVRSNPLLTSLSGLAGLTSVGGDLAVEGNAVLNDLTGLGALVRVGGDFSFGRSLQNLGGLDNLLTVGGALVVNNTGESRLQTVNIPRLKSIGGSLDPDVATLTELNFPELETVGEDIRLEATALDVVDFPLLRTVTGVVQLLGSTGPLSSVRFPSLESCASLRAEGIRATALDVSSLESVGTFSLTSTRLQSVSAPALHAVMDELVLGTNTEVVSVNLPALASAGRINILGETKLPTLELPMLTSVANDLLVHQNTALTTIGFPSLVSVGTRFLLADSGFLTGFSAPVLGSVGSLEIDGNAFPPGLYGPNRTGLPTLALPALATVGGDFAVVDNDMLTSISFPALATVSGAFRVFDNRVLPNCQATELATQVGKACTCSANGSGACP